MLDFKSPPIDTGSVIPYGFVAAAIDEEKAKAEKRADRIHDWKIAIFGVVGGMLAGLITSFIFWMITK